MWPSNDPFSHLERRSRRSSALCSTISSVLLYASRSSCDELAAAAGPLLSGGRSTVASGARPLLTSSSSLQRQIQVVLRIAVALWHEHRKRMSQSTCCHTWTMPVPEAFPEQSHSLLRCRCRFLLHIC